MGGVRDSLVAPKRPMFSFDEVVQHPKLPPLPGDRLKVLVLAVDYAPQHLQSGNLQHGLVLHDAGAESDIFNDGLHLVLRSVDDLRRGRSIGEDDRRRQIDSLGDVLVEDPGLVFDSESGGDLSRLVRVLDWATLDDDVHAYVDEHGQIGDDAASEQPVPAREHGHGAVIKSEGRWCPWDAVVSCPSVSGSSSGRVPWLPRSSQRGGHRGEADGQLLAAAVVWTRAPPSASTPTMTAR